MAISWPIRFFLIILIKATLCVGFSYSLISVIQGQGSLLSLSTIVACFICYAGFSYYDCDKRFLGTKISKEIKISIKNLTMPFLLLAFTCSNIYDNFGLLEVNNIQEWHQALYLFMVIMILNGPMICISMETLCASEGYVFENSLFIIVCGSFFLLTIVAMSINSTQNWQFLNIIVLFMFFLFCSTFQSIRCWKIRAAI